MAEIRLRGIAKRFAGGVTAVQPTDLDFPGGALTALLGPSGCGKTTLLRMIAGLEAPSQGVIELGGSDITDRPAHERRFGMVFQSFALFPHLNVADNVAYSLAVSGMARSDRRSRADALLDLVQLSGYGDRRIGALSGGQRQRVAIARALAQEPQVFLLDEPMSALDAKLREGMQVELRMLQQRLGITTVVVTHDQREAMTMADRIVVMSQGRVEQTGSPDDIYHRPANAFVADFIGRANFFEAIVQDGGVWVAGPGGETVALAVDPAPAFVPGAPVTLAIRPERACLDEPCVPGQHTNRMKAQVTFLRDVGSTRDIHLDTPIGPVIVEYAAGENKRSYALGETVDLDLPASALHVFSKPAERNAA
ncbi:MAG: ABC transporter ATP-binding protein [Pseudomonadota bacterium]